MDPSPLSFSRRGHAAPGEREGGADAGSRWSRVHRHKVGGAQEETWVAGKNLRQLGSELEDKMYVENKRMLIEKLNISVRDVLLSRPQSLCRSGEQTLVSAMF